MGPKVGYRESAEAEFLALPKGARREVKDALARIDPKDPDALPDLEVERIRGTETLWRLALGELRVVFRAEGDRLVVFALGVRPGFYTRFGP